MFVAVEKPSHSRAGRLGRWTTPFLGLLLAVLVYAATRPLPPLKGWMNDYGAALATATATDRRLLVAFHMRRCPPCVAMDRSVLGTGAVRLALEDYVPVRLNVDEQRELANRFQVVATPTYAVVDPRGGLIAVAEGFQPAADFVRFLTRAAVLPAESISARHPSSPVSP